MFFADMDRSFARDGPRAIPASAGASKPWPRLFMAACRRTGGDRRRNRPGDALRRNVYREKTGAPEAAIALAVYMRRQYVRGNTSRSKRC